MSSIDLHKPVLVDEVLQALAPFGRQTYIDGTFGRGGYSKAILAACSDCVVLGIDCDPDAVSAGKQLEKDHPGRFQIFDAKFSEMDRVVKSKGLSTVAGVALDIGVSSVQLDDGDRGFSFKQDAALDMRMSKAGLSAADVVNDCTEEELSNIIYRYGEERGARRVAKEIVRQRSSARIETTLELAHLVERVVGGPRRGRRTHPATKTFQALRIFVNDEIQELAYGLSAAERILADDACLAVVTFHSLEDRLVKRFFAVRSGQLNSVSRHQPPSQGVAAPTFRIQRRRALKPSDAEVRENPRARSAKLRVGYRTVSPPRKLNLSELGLDGLPTRRVA